MKTIEKSTIDFLKALKRNNNRDWFHANREAYLIAKENFESFGQEIIDKIIDLDPIMKGLEIKNCVFRINRDIRFSNDKSPYKTNFGAFIVRGGKKNGDKYSGYYIHLESAECMIAGGAYMPPSPRLAAIREMISKEPKRFHEIIENKEFTKYFGAMEGEKLIKAPKGYPSDHPDVELLKYKSFLAVHKVDDAKVLDESFFDHTMNVIKAMKPFNDFLNGN